MKTSKFSTASEFRDLRVLTLTSGQDNARRLGTMLSAIGIDRVDTIFSLGKAPVHLHDGAIDLIVADVGHGGLMLPSLLKTLSAANRQLRCPHILWVGQPTLENLAPMQKQTILGKQDGLRIGGIAVTALLSHASLARRAGINVGMVRGNSKGGYTEALRDLLLAPPARKEESFLPEQAPTEADVIEALTTGENLRVMLQPQYDLRTRKIIGAEALLRWHHPIHGDVPPSILIPMVNRLGLHLLLFSFIETRVIDILLSLKKRQLELPIALNASVETVCTPGLPERLADKMLRSGLSPQLLKIELTGDLPVEDELCLSASINSLREKQFTVSLDDFGQGSATMNLLARMSFDEVKIDGSFVRDMETNASSRAVIAATSTLARLMNLKLVVEGIEDESCITTLLGLGCRTGQGFALACPMELNDFFAYIAKE